MSDDFFGRPRSAGTIVDPRPAARRAPKTTTTSRSSSTTTTRRRPAAGPAARPARRARPAPGPAPRRRPAPVRVAPAPRAPRARRTRPAPPALTGAQLRAGTIRRLIGFVVVMSLIVLAVGIRLVNVQVVDSHRYLAYGQSQRDGFRLLPASRGAIYDRNSQAFAMSVAQPMVVADPAQVRHPIKVSRSLGHVLGTSPATIEAVLRAKSRYRIIAKHLSQTQVEQIRSRLKAGLLLGISLEDEHVRSTPNGDLANSIIGHAMPEGEKTAEGKSGGISGLELEYDRQLRGTPGKLYFTQDASGRPIAGGHRHLDKARQGTDLYLTLDQALQYETEQAISAQVEATGAKSGQAIIMRPSTGEVLSMASVAADEKGKVSNTIDNRSVTSVFEPGSVNKMITVAGAIEDGVVAPDTILTVPYGLTIYDRQFTDSHPHPTTDWSVSDIIATSSNIGTIRIAQKLGRTQVDHYLRAFGFGSKPGLGFPGETGGIMKDPSEWSGVDIGTMPIGQGIAVSALQMLAAYNVVANDGVYIAPKLVGATDRGAGQVPTEPSSGHRVISASTATKMQAMLAQVVSDGTGKRAAVPGYQSAGKTGTARIAHNIDHTDGYLNENGGYDYQASFVGFVTDADLSIIVTVEEPKTSIFGGDVAAPVFSHLAAMALRRYQVPPPALVDAAARAVPELSATAKEVGREDVNGTTSTTQG